jgi:hypothetical protein
MSKSHLLFLSAAVAALGLLPATLHAETFTDPASAGYWAESWFDASGAYQSPDSSTVSVTGGNLVAAIPTDADQSNTARNTVSYVRTMAELPGAAAAYDGSLLGDLTSKTSLTAVFSLNNSTLAAGEPFTNDMFVASALPGNDPHPVFRFVFTGPVFLPSGVPNQWWSNPVNIDATSMNNGVAVTMTASLDPSQWSNYNGHFGNDPLAAGEFQSALSNVSRMGIAFSTDVTFGDGFGFNTGGDGSLNFVSFSSAVPEPASLSLLAIGGIALLTKRRRKA